MTHALFAPSAAFGAFLTLIPAIGSVLGGVSNSIAVGLAAGILVTALVWQIGSAAVRRRSRASFGALA